MMMQSAGSLHASLCSSVRRMIYGDVPEARHYNIDGDIGQHTLSCRECLETPSQLSRKHYILTIEHSTFLLGVPSRSSNMRTSQQDAYAGVFIESRQQRSVDAAVTHASAEILCIGVAPPRTIEKLDQGMESLNNHHSDRSALNACMPQILVWGKGTTSESMDSSSC